MKEQYFSPTVELVALSERDVISTSEQNNPSIELPMLPPKRFIPEYDSYDVM